MNYLKEIFDFIQRLFVWWVIVSPWENGLRVRGGKKVKLLTAGIHFRIPFYDTVFVQPIRLRIVSIPPQTITTPDGHTITVMAAMGYSIASIELLFQTISRPDSTICNMVMGSVADYIGRTALADCTPAKIEESIMAKLNPEKYGIKMEMLKITGFAIVKTYRLIQDQHWMPDGLDISTPVK